MRFFFDLCNMDTEKYIADLLYRYNCVVVPEFGAFLTQIKSAVLHKSTYTFDPPSKIISFNEQLSSNDGLLVSYMANAEKTSYEEMLGRMHEQVGKWKKQLQQGKRLSMSNIGELWLNREGRILFQPSYSVNYLTSSFGLAPLVSATVTREELKQEVVKLEEQIPFMITPEERNKKGMRPYLKYAAVVLLAFATGLTGFGVLQNARSSQELARQDAQQVVARNIQEATFFNSAPLELPALNLEIRKVNTKKHHVIAGAFRYKENADKKVSQLRDKGYDAHYLGENRYGLHQVAYASFHDAKEALQYLREVKLNLSSDAWLLSDR